MKTSQKGTKLNDVRYFRQSRPYTRKRITTMRLIPELPGLHGIAISSPKDQTLQPNHRRSCEKSRERRITLDCDQRSREIAWISYMSDSEDSEEFCTANGNSGSHWRDIFVETDPEKEIHVYPPEPADLPPEVSKNVKLPKKLEAEKEVQAELELQVEEKNIGVEESVEESKSEAPGKPEVREEPEEEIEREVRQEIPKVRSNKNSSDSERSFWLRYGGIRKILDFFGHLLGKRAPENDDSEAKRTVEARKLVAGNVDNPANEAKNKKSQLKRSSKRKSPPTRKNTATKQPEDRAFPGLTKQIMNTRDKRLRATLMEHEMRARMLEEENRRYRKILQQKLKTRQMSNPLH